jgi:hypothetical protein
LKDLFVNRLVHGFWSLGAYAVDGESDLYRRVLYLDAIGQRVITRLQLPLPVRPPVPRNPKTAERMIDAILDYIESAPGIRRWNDWRVAVVKRGGKTTLDEAASVLGVPVWFLDAFVKADPNLQPDDSPIVKRIGARAKRENLSGVTMD